MGEARHLQRQLKEKETKMSINQRRNIAGRALQIRDTLGVRVAAGYCRNNGLSIEYTLSLLLGE